MASSDNTRSVATPALPAEQVSIYTIQGNQYPKYCPHPDCEWPGKQKLLFDGRLVSKHEKKHASWPCEVESCLKTFSTKRGAVAHFSAVHLQRRNFACTHNNEDGTPCGKAFISNQNLEEHINGAHTKIRFFTCPNCGLESHWPLNRNVHPDHCGSKKEPPKPKYVHGTADLSEHARKRVCTSTTSNSLRTNAGTSSNQDDMGLGLFDGDDDSDGIELSLQDLVLGTYTDELCDLIEARNESYIEKWPGLVQALSPAQASYSPEHEIFMVPEFFQCKGTGTSHGVQRSCPYELEGLTKRNTLLRVLNNKISMSSHCFLCGVINGLLRGKDIFERSLAREAQGLCIASVNCSEPVPAGHKRCVRHHIPYTDLQAKYLVLKRGDDQLLPDNEDEVLALARQTMGAISRQFLPTSYNSLLAPNVRQFAINTEFSVLKGSGKEAQGRAKRLTCTVGIVDARTKEVLLHTRLDHGKSGRELLAKYYAEGSFVRSHIKKYYMADSNIPIMTDAQIYRRLEDIGFKDGAVVEWSISGHLDIGQLKDHLNAAGLDASAVIPPPARRFSTLRLLGYDFNAQARSRGRVTPSFGIEGVTKLKLQRIYRLLCLDGAYADQHHEADVDAIKCAEVTAEVLKLAQKASNKPAPQLPTSVTKVFIYIPLTYPQYAASLFAGNDFARSSIAAGAIHFSRPMFLNLGVGPGVSLLAGLTFGGCIGIWALWYYGAALRARSRFAAK